jgi:hypothetical protein
VNGGDGGGGASGTSSGGGGGSGSSFIEWLTDVTLTNNAGAAFPVPGSLDLTWNS